MNIRIKEVRITAKLTQDEFGKKIGISNTAVSKIEKGENNVSEQNILSICREFNISEEWLRTGNGEMVIELSRDKEITAWASKITRADFDNKFILDFVHTLSKLDESDWETLEKIAIMMKKKNPGKSQNLSKKETSQPYMLNAAHERTDIIPSQDGQAHDDAIMNDDSEWE